MSIVLSQAMTTALGKIVGDEPNHIGVIEIKGETLLLVLGRFKFYFVDKSLKDNSSPDLLKPVAYQNIERIEYDLKRSNLFQLIYSD